MRAFEIAFACVILQASIVFVGTLGIFQDDPLGSTKAVSEYTQWTIEGNKSTLGNISASENQSLYIPWISEAWLYASWLMGAFIWFVKFIFCVIFIYPTLVNIFGIPSNLSALLQVGIFAIYIWGWISWKSNRQSKYIE